MKIDKLDMHCGNCSIIYYCDEPYSDICICCDSRFQGVEENKFIELADNSKRKSKKAIINDVASKIGSEEK